MFDLTLFSAASGHRLVLTLSWPVHHGGQTRPVSLSVRESLVGCEEEGEREGGRKGGRSGGRKGGRNEVRQ